MARAHTARDAEMLPRPVLAEPGEVEHERAHDPAPQLPKERSAQPRAVAHLAASGQPGHALLRATHTAHRLLGVRELVTNLSWNMALPFQ